MNTASYCLRSRLSKGVKSSKMTRSKLAIHMLNQSPSARFGRVTSCAGFKRGGRCPAEPFLTSVTVALLGVIALSREAARVTIPNLLLLHLLLQDELPQTRLNLHTHTHKHKYINATEDRECTSMIEHVVGSLSIR